MKPTAENHRQYIGIKQTKRTIAKIQRRQRLGTQRPTDKQNLLNAQKALQKWEQM